VLTGGDDGLVKHFDLETRECLSSRSGHHGAVWCVQRHGHVVVTGATDGSLRLGDLRTEAAVWESETAHGDAIAGMQVDDTKVLTASFDTTVKIWDLRMGLSHRATLHAPGGMRCTRLGFDDTRIVTGSLNGSLACFDVL